MNKLHKSICIYLSYLRALHFLHQQHHWIAKGPAFYALHALYEKLAATALASSDKIAEEFVGLFDEDCIDLTSQIDCFNQIIKSIPDELDLINKSLFLETKFLEYAQNFLKAFKNDHPEQLTFGLEDILNEIMFEHEGSCYHLNRTIKA